MRKISQIVSDRDQKYKITYKYIYEKSEEYNHIIHEKDRKPKNQEKQNPQTKKEKKNQPTPSKSNNITTPNHGPRPISPPIKFPQPAKPKGKNPPKTE